jgi:hypothetical protein
MKNKKEIQEIMLEILAKLEEIRCLLIIFADYKEEK